MHENVKNPLFNDDFKTNPDSEKKPYTAVYQSLPMVVYQMVVTLVLVIAYSKWQLKVGFICFWMGATLETNKYAPWLCCKQVKINFQLNPRENIQIRDVIQGMWSIRKMKMLSEKKSDFWLTTKKKKKKSTYAPTFYNDPPLPEYLGMHSWHDRSEIKCREFVIFADVGL